MQRYQEATVQQAATIMSTLGARTPDELGPHMLRKVISPTETKPYAELYEWLEPGQLLAEAPETWAADWKLADPHAFNPQVRDPRNRHR